jgi:hypothetical protein
MEQRPNKKHNFGVKTAKWIWTLDSAKQDFVWYKFSEERLI